jgi:hypothetical protein
VRLLVFTVVGLCAMVTGYAFGLGGAVSSLIFLFILFNGVLDRVLQPLLAKLRA